MVRSLYLMISAKNSPKIMEEFAGVKVLAQSYTGGSPYQLLTTNKGSSFP